MATVTLLLVDVDSQDGGNCQVAMVVDTTTVAVTEVTFFNTSQVAQADFTITTTKGQTRSAHIPPNTGTPANPSVITPPFSPGNWTPGVVQNTSGSGPPYQGDGTWSLSFTGWK